MSTKFLFAHQKFTIMAKIPNETIDEYFGRTFKFWVTSRVLKFPPEKHYSGNRNEKKVSTRQA